MDNTREKLIELVHTARVDVLYDNPPNPVQYVVDHLIANGVRLEEKQATSNESKWIPVTERLPEVATSHNTRWDKSTDSIRVLCACVQADGKKMVKEGYCKVYSDGFVSWKIPGTIHSVTHWMPLPEPPKED